MHRSEIQPPTPEAFRAFLENCEFDYRSVRPWERATFYPYIGLTPRPDDSEPGPITAG